MLFFLMINKMRKNILVLSHVYPGAGVPDTFTPVVHYFVKEWRQMGYNVRVVSIWNYFPCFYYMAPNWLKKMAIKKFGCVLPEKQLPDDISYELDGVRVYRYTLKKIMPASRISEKQLDELSLKIERALCEETFVPDYIISHWATPQIYVSNKLKKVYATAKTALILHEDGKRIKQYDNWRELVANVDVWGYRSLAIKQSFESEFGEKKRSFRCCSGIPSHYLENLPKREWNHRNRYIYVGYLLRRKFADVAIKAVAEACTNSEFQFNIIGNGEMQIDLENLVFNEQLQNSVHLLGRLKRDQILSYLDSSDVFVMISKNEVFGLVYLEAMARGCVVIASRNEGMEGIIVDGYNGFLCEAGNQNELIGILTKINSLPPEKLQEISCNASRTAEQYTDVAVARNYINYVKQL